ncbi:hypothetical protein K1T71_012577 [Dendrolimus kikuchii]|uniref:Uncharacterized protein n=1 Tax=Dendrolimus kikuchii TaxID=765133 RepID=A0ACC1CJS6_9NEOP|nr:hypothetical protein K1T71_012577 [Dendrolimus kikuchii]
MGLDINNTLGSISYIEKSETAYMINYSTGESAKLNILNSHVFKFYMSPTGDFKDYPTPIHADDKAKINIKSVIDYDSEDFEKSTLTIDDIKYIIETTKIMIVFNKLNAKLTVFDKRTNKEVLKEKEALCYGNLEAKQVLYENDDEFFFGGGLQNGRFTHKGESIKIFNTNIWVDGGVASPCPFYWSSAGYGVLRNTWQSGVYDFGSKVPGQITTVHHETDYDAFVFINHNPTDILGDYYELTGRPIFMPEYAFYEAHLNKFNRDYWVRVSADTPGAILFEDGQYYKNYKPDCLKDKEGILESLNGENDNYQFSGRAMIDRYKMHNMPLGWFLPNDGYGSGYGQTETLDGDIKNLEEFQLYAKENGVEVALWTESKLIPTDPQHLKKDDRDLAKEVRMAGVVALKCDVAWVGEGYSLGLNAAKMATDIFNRETTHNVRPMIIMVDGWAGTQRYAGIWSGDQHGGQWEYIRFHIPTYIGAGLSGMPVIGSDMDGIYGGNVKEINIRDFQWKAFTPLQLNMDGWGSLRKTPFSFDYEATAINRAYLKMKSMLMPYNYTIGYKSTEGLPMVRGMFLEFPKEISAYTKDSQYQFMWGPSILVAPVYKMEKSISDDTIRNGIYLPDTNQVWIDLLTGYKYQGGKIYNNFKTPIWKIPVFIKVGAILPMTKSNNNPNEIKKHERIFMIYPSGGSEFEVYEDDGMTSNYLKEQFANTKITVIGPKTNEEGDLEIHIDKTKGSYHTMAYERNTMIKIKVSEDSHGIKGAINGQDHEIKKVYTIDDFKKNENVYFFSEEHITNKFLLEFAPSELKQKFLLIKLKSVDVTSNDIAIKVQKFSDKSEIIGNITNLDKTVPTPSLFTVIKQKSTATSLSLSWSQTKCLYYEIERDGMVFTNILGNSFTFDNFKPSSQHSFKIRSVKDTGFCKWSYTIIAETDEDPLKYAVKDVKVCCNIPSQPNQEVTNLLLTKKDLNILWHTDWNKPYSASTEEGRIILTFDLQDVYEIDKVEYLPRDDCGNGTLLEIQYRISTDGQNWTPFSDVLKWELNNDLKTILFNGQKMKYLELRVLSSVGGFGSGRSITFYKVPE